jgi:hypothetical protein
MHFEIPADDLERAKNFYEQLFNWEIEASGPDFPDYYIIKTRERDEEGNPKGPGIDGGMMPRTNPGQPIINYITVEDIEEYLGKLKELGGKILMPKMPVKGMGYNAVVQDTEANTFGLWEDDKSAE